MSREKPLIVVLLSFFSRAPHAKVTVGGYGDKVPLRSALLAMQRTFGTYIHCCYNATYSMLMLTKQDSLHNHIATEGVSNYFSIKLKNESML